MAAAALHHYVARCPVAAGAVRAGDAEERAVGGVRLVRLDAAVGVMIEAHHEAAPAADVAQQHAHAGAAGTAVPINEAGSSLCIKTSPNRPAAMTGAR